MSSPELEKSSESIIARPASTGPLQTEASGLLTSKTANDATNAQQVMQLLGQGLKDVSSGQNEAYGVLELMKGASLKPEIVQDQSFLSNLKTALGDEHSHTFSSSLPSNDRAQQVGVQPVEAQTQPGLQPGGQAEVSPQSRPTGTDGAGVPPTSDASGSLIQQGLSAIAGGDKMAGIMSLMQAAQLNPNIMNDSRFVNALQAALSQGASKSANSVDQSGAKVQASGGPEQLTTAVPRPTTELKAG